MEFLNVYVVNRATVPLGIDPQALQRTLRAYLERVVNPVWGSAAYVIDSRSKEPRDAVLYVADDSDSPGAVGYHEDPDGSGPLHPRGYAFVRTAERSGLPLSVVATHELCEMVVNPHCTRTIRSPRGRWLAIEPCDPVQRSDFPIDGVPVANLVTPAWFGMPGGQYDVAGACKRRWEILEGGYIPYWTPGGWSNLFGSQEADRLYHAERHHRVQHIWGKGLAADLEATTASDPARKSVLA